MSALAVALAQLILRGLAPEGVTALFSPKGVTAAALYGTAFLLYFNALRHIPLHLAYQYAALTYVVVVVAAAMVLGERVNAVQYIGMMLAAVGMSLVFVGVKGGGGA